MWNFVAMDGVWIPMMYLYFYNFCYISNPAWYNFMYLGLNFTDFEVGVLFTIGSLLRASACGRTRSASSSRGGASSTCGRRSSRPSSR